MLSENELAKTSEKLPLIASDCFDNFFSGKEIPPHKLLEWNILKKGLCSLLKDGLSEHGSETSKVDEISSKEDLIKIFNNIDPKYLGQIDRSYLRGKHKITDAPSLEFEGDMLSASNGEVLQNYIKEKNLSVVASLSQGDSSSYVSTIDGGDDKTIFNINSVGKVINGALVMKMLQEGVIEESQLKQPVQLDSDVLQALPKDVQERLETTTLHQLMTHTSGLLDYLPKYIGGIEEDVEAIKKAKKEGDDSVVAKIPTITQTEDLLQFADEKVLSKKELRDPPNEGKKYSNLGTALVGLAVQKAYNDKYSQEHSGEEPYETVRFDEIRRKHVLVPAGITIFENYMPEGSCAHPDDDVSPLISGGPDGGQWTDLESLNKFGKWFCDEWKAPKKEGESLSFKESVEKYGQEFYKSEKGLVDHNGAGPAASSYLSIFPETQTVFVSLANNRFDAIAIHDLTVPVLEDKYSPLEQVGKKEAPQTFVEKFCGNKKSKEAEDAITSSPSWVDKIESNKAKDDSEIVR